MDTEVDLTTVDRDVLIAIIAELQAVIERLQRRIAELEGQAKPDDPPRMPGLKSSSGRQPPAQQQPSKQRRHGFARPRMTPTHRVEHVVESCPDCGTHPTGGWIQRTREVIELPVVPAQVTEHVYMARIYPGCRRRRVPTAQLDGAALGRQRLGVNLISRIATLREEGRLPIRSVQWYLRTVHQLRLSVGPSIARRSGPNRRWPRCWTASAPAQWSTPTKPAGVSTGPTATCGLSAPPPNATSCERYFLRRGRGKTVVDEALGDAFSGVLVSDCYAAYHHYDGPKQRCWAHLLRDIHDQRTRYPKDAALARWAAAVHQLYVAAKACNHHEPWQRRVAQLAWECKLLAICRPFLSDPSAVQGKLCRRIEHFIKELFVFVAEPDVPSDNNAAERSLRHLVISRKVSGGTRSEQGTERKMTLVSIFGTWRAQGLNPLAACRQLLVSPRL